MRGRLVGFLSTVLVLGCGVDMEGQDAPLTGTSSVPEDVEVVEGEDGLDVPQDDDDVLPLELAQALVSATCTQARVEGTGGQALNVRGQASRTASVLGTLPLGATVTVLSTAVGDTVDGVNLWYRVQQGTLSGFASARYLGCTASNTPPCGRVRVTGTDGENLNVRAAALASSAVVGLLPADDTIAVLNTVEGGSVGGVTTWHEVERGSLRGFVTSRFTTCVPNDPPPPPPGGSCGEGPVPALGETTWPMPNRRSVAQRYRNPSSYQTCGFHTGIDIGARMNDPVLAMAPGKVIHVGPMWYNGATSGRGPYAIIIQHAPRFFSTYGHNESALVAVGDCVTAGQRIANAGTRGYSSGPHLHFEIVTGVDFTGDWRTPFRNACQTYRDPLAYTRP